ncbi:hypothetical protein [Dactylosporangium fulvum]|uniref:Pycsar effector protein domain-containing protein n=1 Tax=Dactylosporangium fulvum TaxID=53359 RepID=A0ABY5W258_9ACTN|nr:hypothetical protein [Dactylosporangium fulvum]UWP83129.1 hypothetical protein Dfulv_02130 [Dactylosporangium fulvum]
MSEAPKPLDPLEDLRIAVSVGAAAQTSIQHADTKAALLLTGLAGAAALAANQPGLIAAAAQAGITATVGMIGLGSAIVAGVAVAGWHLGRCLVPRLTGPESLSGNRFALPDLGARWQPHESTPVEQQRDEAWAAAVALAGIAMRKYRAIRACLPWAAVTVVGSISWLCLGLAFGAR